MEDYENARFGLEVMNKNGDVIENFETNNITNNPASLDIEGLEFDPTLVNIPVYCFRDIRTKTFLIIPQSIVKLYALKH